MTEIVGSLKAGKEAQVFVCRAHPKTGRQLLAAKVYKSREKRSFRSEATYLEGHGGLVAGRKKNDSVARAIDRRSKVGKALLEEIWVNREYDILRTLWRLGCRVPQPMAVGGGAVLMAYLGNEDEAAPRLQAYQPTEAEAHRFREDLLHVVESLLGANLIHGDLSPYNVLVWEGEVWVIDVPQAVDAHIHPDGASLFLRDVTNITRYFSRYGVADDGRLWGQDLWARYERGKV